MSLDARLHALAEAADVAEGRLDEDLVAAAHAVVAKAGARLGLGVETTVVALAGPTGAGKSSLFNALAGDDLAQVGRRRPTTAAAAAAVWGDGGAPLLDWLEVPRRHRRSDEELDGLVLLDLPDFDSVETSHRLEVDRLVELVDLVVWVVDPQKYADSAWHDGYLRRLAQYGEAMAVVLNQADVLDGDAVAACRADLARLLARDGTSGVPILVVSARTGLGLEELRRLLAERVAAREAVMTRLAADVSSTAARFEPACGGRAPGVGSRERDDLVAALADAAGVDMVALAVGRAHRRSGTLATGWPYLRWLKRLRPDPLRRLHLGPEGSDHARTSLPPPSGAQVARAENAARALAAAASEGLPEPWPGLVRSAATPDPRAAADELDRAVGAADLHVQPPYWWRLVGPLQRVLAAAVAVGVVWLLGLFLLEYLQLDDVVPTPEANGIPLPTALLVGGVAGGIALAFLARLANGVGARRRSRAAARSVRKRVEASARTLVLDPVEAELDAYSRFCAALDVAASAGPTRAGRGRRRRRHVATSPA